MGMPLIFMIFSAFTVCASSGFHIPSISAVSTLLKANLGPPSLSFHENYGSNYISPTMSTSPNFERKSYGTLAPSPKYSLDNLAPKYSSPTKAPARRHGKFHRHHHDPSYIPQTHTDQGDILGPSTAPSRSNSPFAASSSSPAPAPSKDSNQFITAPTSSFVKNRATPPPSSFLTLPPPPHNKDCTSMTCTDPLTYTPSGFPCGCVWPIEVKLRLNVALYTFFPLVTELSKEIASSFSFNQSQVRIMGANAANQQEDQTVVLVNLVPLRENFNGSMALGIYNKFWQKLVLVKPSVYGAYDVVYVQYPGLPSSPPSVTSSLDTMNNVPYPRNRDNRDPIKPIGVDVSGKKKDNSNRSYTIVIVLSSITAFVVCMVVVWLLVLNCGCVRRHGKNQTISDSSHRKPSAGDVGSTTFATVHSSASISVSSNKLAYTGTAKIFSLDEMEIATDYFNPSRILGEGGFGLVYRGILDNGQNVAVKVLKRDDRQGDREFLAEVEMLSRLHHRNLVKLIGICTEDHYRSLVYELVPNGSVESHLHGIDKEVSPLDWSARMKIALGSARGLAYLHEDSSPRVIHRDFKSSNILLEHDFTPKVSDFGLARTAMEEQSKHVSTQVMGTFGYLAPEYAMTGHLLVKSDVYSYGVVLLELLTGRKPVDLSQPPGQENLVAWARPLLATKEGLESMIDHSLGPNVLFDSVSKVAAISSMCVQPEVSHRPFMGEVVQALKLVCNEFDETKVVNDIGTSGLEEGNNLSRSCSGDDVYVDDSGELMGDPGTRYLVPGYVYNSNETKVALSTPDLMTETFGFEGDLGYLGKECNSAPLSMSTKKPFWKRLKGLSIGGTT